ncbi:uncharacterized protein LOC131619910 [Vicia villosa]|uniref:uncharacterized protein LOC131619910 n=1 Tax=Vicia villosa TaxID=3911 RepID=UPI00273A93BE|nr:uncharacterized protein LOC131619910 [Vicia villosa]
MLTPRIIRNPVNVSERSQFTLSVFGLPGRPSGKKGVHWLTQQEMQSAHVHVLINCVEVKPFLEEFNNTYFHTTGVQSTSGVIHAQFPAWFKERMYSIVAPTPEILHLRNLSQGPIQSANEWHTYFVNGYKFHTHTWTEGKKTINSGVFVKGVTDGGEDDFYGFVKHIYELVKCHPDLIKSQVNRMSMASTQGFLPLLSSQYPYDSPSFITPPPPGYPSFQQTQMPPSFQET